ncbi:MAG: hypothetical protein ACJKTH_03715 [Patescibacteria group bacterium UBA2163]
MEPLSLKTRRIVSLLFFALFALITPIVVLYASGYRLDGFSLVSNGGVYLSAPISGTSIHLNGEVIGRTSLFSKSFFLDNIEPGSYVVQGRKDGYHTWSKDIVVESQLVTNASMFVVPQPIEMRLVQVEQDLEIHATTTNATSTTQYVSEREYIRLQEAFTVSTTTDNDVNTVASSTQHDTAEPSLPVAESDGAALVINNGNLLLKWTRNTAPPSSFCTRPSLCVSHFFLEEGKKTVTHAQFFAGGVLYQTEHSGVFLVEADIRQPRLLVQVATAPQAVFRVIDGSLYIKDGELFYRVSGF